ncbi:MAG: CRTAC1 family protein [Aureliella sp.]
MIRERFAPAKTIIAGLRRAAGWSLAAALLAPSAVAHAQTGLKARIDEVPPLQAGIDFVHFDGASGRRYIVETVLGSLALFDYDNDGLIDIYFVNGAALPGTRLPAAAVTNRLYKNNGNWHFTDVTDASGLGDAQYGMGVVVGDVDQDGDADVFLSNFGKNTFYVNQGDGTFLESSQAWGVSGSSRFGAGNALLDMEGDGDLDLYCASYVEFDYSQHKTRTIAGHEFHTGPNDYRPAVDYLYRNNGDGTFSDVSAWSGIAQLRAPGMGVLSADFDDDRDMDIFVANDQKPNFLLLNNGRGQFSDEGLLAGVAVDRLGRSNGNMGVDYADFNGDGLLDLVTTTYQDEMPVLYQAVSPGLFSDVTNVARIDSTLNAHVKWGVGGIDFDNDADRDLFIACGHFLDNIRVIDDRTDVKVVNYLLANDGRGRFTNVTRSAGSALSVVESTRSVGFDDLDNDGDVDFVALNVAARPTLGRTEPAQAGRGVWVALVGTVSNRDAVGAKIVAVSESGKRQTQVATAGKGYESDYGKRLYFGTGGESLVRFEVWWPSGLKESFRAEGPATLLVEGRSAPHPPTAR